LQTYNHHAIAYQLRQAIAYKEKPMTILYAIAISYKPDFAAGLEKVVLSKLFRAKPSIVECDAIVEDWTQKMARSCDEGESLWKVGSIHRVDVIDFYLG